MNRANIEHGAERDPEQVTGRANRRETMEDRWIERITRSFGRSPLQLNGVSESDAEVVAWRPREDSALAVTVDGIAEETEAGLYAEPHLLGWVAVMASLSDLAAVGAEPIGILLSEVLPREASDSWVSGLQGGIEEACASSGTFVLGGDLGFGPRSVITCCAIGWVERSRRLSRTGARPGDALYTTGPVGLGNAFALERLVLGSKDVRFRPFARLREGRVIAPLATACMDTSDGVLATLDQISRLNRVGFALEGEWRGALLPEVEAVARRAGLPAWALLAGQHGDFELVFTVPPTREEELHEAGAACGFYPLRIGRVVAHPEVSLIADGRRIAVDTVWLRDLAFCAGSDPSEYIAAVRRFCEDAASGDGGRKRSAPRGLQGRSWASAEASAEVRAEVNHVER